MNRIELIEKIEAEFKKRNGTDKEAFLKEALKRMSDLDLAAFAYQTGLISVK